MGVAVRNNRRIGPGWRDGMANTGWSHRRGWYAGLHLLTAVDRRGVVTGDAVAPPVPKNSRMPRISWPLGPPRRRAGPYLADRGVEGRERHRPGLADFGAAVLVPPRNDRKHSWHAPLRQIVEVAHSKWTEQFRLDDERPHMSDGFLARVAAMAAVHNAGIWINRQLGRESLAFADLIDW